MTFSCIYCNSILPDSISGIFTCISCSCEVTYICNGSTSSIDIIYIQLFLPNYLIEFNFEDNSTTIFKEHIDNVKDHIILNYIPGDLNPISAPAWLDRILNLNLFY